jgi:hypothetical protein
MMRRLALWGVVVGCLTCLSASTLQRLTLDDMILKSTMIVQGTVQPGSTAAMRGPIIYTHYQIAVTATYKGTPSGQTASGQTPSGQTIDVAVPGGALNGMLQPVAGAPTLNAGQQYFFFLWTSKSGLTQVIGLSQGLFGVSTNAQGQVVVSRAAASAPMLDSSGNPVTDTSLQIPLGQLVSQIQSVLAGTGNLPPNGGAVSGPPSVSAPGGSGQ